MGGRKWLGKEVRIVRGSLGEVGTGLEPEERPERARHSYSMNRVLGWFRPGSTIQFPEVYTAERAWGLGGSSMFQNLGDITKGIAIPWTPWKRSQGQGGFSS